jgi:hypothetical protein
MAQHFLKNVGIAVLRVTDEYDETDVDRPKQRELGSGFYEVGLVIDGAFVTLMELKGGAVDAQIAAWQKAHPPAQEAEPEPDASTE